MGRGMERNPIRKVAQSFARSTWACEMNRGRLGGEKSLNRLVQVTFSFPTYCWHFARLQNGFLSYGLSSQPPSNFEMFSQGKAGLRNKFAQAFQISH